MSDELFKEYRAIKDGSPVAAAKLAPENITKLSVITGGTAVAKKVRGGSMVYCELILHGESGKTGDYVISDRENAFFPVPKSFFEARYKYHGPLRITPSSERR